MIEFDKLYNQNPEFQAFSMAERLAEITKREAMYRRHLKGKIMVPENVLTKHNLLIWGQSSLVTELCDMGFKDLALASLELGARMDAEKSK